MPVQWNEQCVVVTSTCAAPRMCRSPDIAADARRAPSTNWTTRTGSVRRAVAVEPPRLQGARRRRRRAAGGHLPQRRVAAPGHAPHDPSAIGLTTVMYVNTPGSRGDGTILDADIELNNVNYTFTIDPANAVARPGTQVADLENTLTHELGHVQGLAHTCWDHITMQPPLDNTGQPIPDCNDPDPAAERSPTRRCFPTRRWRARPPSATSARTTSPACARSISRSRASSAAIPRSTAAPAARRRPQRRGRLAAGRRSRWSRSRARRAAEASLLALLIVTLPLRAR